MYQEDGTLHQFGEWSMLFGVLGLGALLPVIQSSVSGGQFSYKEWYITQFVFGMVCIVFALVHVIVMGNPPGTRGWLAIGDPDSHSGMPSITFMSSIAALFCVFVRLVVWMLPSSLQNNNRRLMGIEP